MNLMKIIMELNTRLKPSRAKIEEKYIRKGTKLPWLFPHEKPVKRNDKEFTRLYHVKSAIPQAKGIRKNEKHDNSEHFRNLKHKALKPGFMKSVPITRREFAELQYSHKLANEAEISESYFSTGDPAKRPLRELVDISLPARYSVEPIVSIHGLVSMPFYQLAKGYETQSNDKTYISESFIRRAKRIESHSESAEDLINLLMYRKGYREKFGKDPDVDTTFDTATGTIKDFDEMIQQGVATNIRRMLANAKEQGWKPGKLNSDGMYQNPLRLAFVKDSNELNQIPRAFANMLEKNSKGYMLADDNFTKVNAEHRTNTNGEYSLFNQPKFDGNVTSGAYYAILDDVMTSGATLMNLGGSITADGGHVIGYYALAHSNKQPDMISIESVRHMRKREIKRHLKGQLANIDSSIQSMESKVSEQTHLQNLIDTHKKTREHIKNELANPKTGTTYEKVLSSLLHTEGHDALEKVLRNKFKLSFLSMNQSELQTVLRLLSYVKGKPSKKSYDQYAPYIVAAVINDPSFNPVDIKPALGSASTMKELINKFKTTHSIDDVKKLPSMFL